MIEFFQAQPLELMTSQKAVCLFGLINWYTCLYRNLYAGKRQCVQCEKDAEYECKECSFSHVIEAPCFCASFCDTCCAQIHKHHKRKNHGWKDIRFGQELELCEEGEELELFAVVCIERSHYVSFVKFEDNEWVFFDSMADRRGNFTFSVPLNTMSY